MSDLHIPQPVAALYERTGPFATVYVDATRSTEAGTQEVQLRMEGLAGMLAEQGADEQTVTAVKDAVLGDDPTPGPHGVVVVAAAGNVLLRTALPKPPVRDLAVWAPLPHVLPLLAQSAPRIAHVVVIGDKTGADVITVPAATAATGTTPPPRDVEGSNQFPVHNTGRDDWSERHHQNRVQNSWAENAAEVSQAVSKEAQSISAELVVIGGDPTVVGLLRRDLPAVLGQGVDIVEVADASRATGGNELPDSVADAVLRHQWRQRREVLEHLQQNLGREKWAVAGVAPVFDALRQAQVDTIVLSDDPSSSLTAWIGPAPLDVALSRQDLEATGVESPQEVRLDAALVRAVAGSGAQLLITPNAHQYVTDGIGALLRF